MNLHQLQAICGIVRNRYNMSRTAEALGRSQSGLSRQIKEFELELGAQVFVRTRNKVVGLTAQGEQILRVGQRVLQDVKTISQIGQETALEEGGEIRIATTHVHARYLLPGTINAFTQRFPRLVLTLQQCDPVQARASISAGDADVGVITMPQRTADPITTIPVYRIPRCVVAPVGHPLLRERALTLKKLAEFPLIAYPATFSGRTIMESSFAREGLKPRIVCSATDADVCKTYVQLGMGIAVLATIAFDPAQDKGLVAMDANHLFQPGILSLVFRTHGYLSRPMQSFLALFAPHIPPGLITRAIAGADIDRARLMQRLPVAPTSHATKA